MMHIETPFGPAWATVNAAGAVTAFGFGSGGADGLAVGVQRQVDEYFEGRRRTFDLPLEPAGTPFQKRVWAELQRIPFGETIGYAELARRMDRPGAARAVGRANATNPIALIVPCHRVIGSDGKLTGYAYGLALKDKLLQWERTLRVGKGGPMALQATQQNEAAGEQVG
jgi:methylated-DNA-[protein]-cysteine S-methyltransferase